MKSNPFKQVTHELTLLALVLLEIFLFALIGKNFFSVDNSMEIVRLAQLGLIALALTPVIISGGIDLSVGSLMGLSRGGIRHAFGATHNCRSRWRRLRLLD